jgi:hypothetical protein
MVSARTVPNYCVIAFRPGRYPEFSLLSSPAEFFVPSDGRKTMMANNRNALQDIERFPYTIGCPPIGFERFRQIGVAPSYEIDYLWK